MGTSANAVLIQVWTAMIAFLLVRSLQTLAKLKEIKWNTSNLVVFLRLNLLNKTNLWYWLYNPYKSVCAKPPDSHQGDLFAKTGYRYLQRLDIAVSLFYSFPILVSYG